MERIKLIDLLIKEMQNYNNGQETYDCFNNLINSLYECE